MVKVTSDTKNGYSDPPDSTPQLAPDPHSRTRHLLLFVLLLLCIVVLFVLLLLLSELWWVCMGSWLH